jgi:hypothetical protein
MNDSINITKKSVFKKENNTHTSLFFFSWYFPIINKYYKFQLISNETLITYNNNNNIRNKYRAKKIKEVID